MSDDHQEDAAVKKTIRDLCTFLATIPEKWVHELFTSAITLLLMTITRFDVEHRDLAVQFALTKLEQLKSTGYDMKEVAAMATANAKRLMEEEGSGIPSLMERMAAIKKVLH